MDHELLNIKNDAISMILAAETVEELNTIKLNYLGRSGRLTMALKELPKIPVEERPLMGKKANDVKNAIEEIITDRLAYVQKSTKKLRTSHLDVTAPGISPNTGSLHLVTQAIEEITTIFTKIGFTRVRYPEVEWDWFAFEALNFPDSHPARDDWETFFMDVPEHSKYGPLVLTPHTSSGQIRELLAAQNELDTGKLENLSIKMLNIAKTYRRQSDVSHTQMFHQFEGLVIDRNISITHLKGVLDYFVKSYFGEKRTSRIRPYQFQFTEPSFEVDVSCGICEGKGVVRNGQSCRLCKEGWLEMGGAGMVHPNVLNNCGVDPKIYNGFAFGWGVERVLMMKEGLEIDDLRLLYGNDLRFLEQF
jgi:phenylalanyl-tRNA synthetase alpha chain